MADFCYFCKKKIGFFDTSSRTAFAQTVCGNCVNKVNRVAILYNREFSEYTLYSLEDAGKILEKAPSFEMYISRYLKIRAEYEPQIQHYQELAEKEKKTLKEIEKGMDDDRREYEAELKECEKEWKAERASSDYKNELKEYEKARRRDLWMLLMTTIERRLKKSRIHIIGFKENHLSYVKSGKALLNATKR